MKEIRMDWNTYQEELDQLRIEVETEVWIEAMEFLGRSLDDEEIKSYEEDKPNELSCLGLAKKGFIDKMQSLKKSQM